MLPLKPQRQKPAGRSSRLADETADPDETQWSSQLPLPVQSDLTEPATEANRTRLLRTGDDKPTAPRLQDLFPQEARSIDRVVTFWDPGSTWPAGALSDLHGPGVAEPGATRLVHGETMRSFALIHHTAVTTSAGELCAVLHVEANPADVASADVALMLLERSDHAVILSGGNNDHRDLPRRLHDFCRQAAWRGPTLQFVAPQDKPSRADRLRKTSWPRSLRMQVLELTPAYDTGWLALLLERVAEGVALEGVVRPAQAPAVRVLVPSQGDQLQLVPPPPPRATAQRTLHRRPTTPIPQRPSPGSCKQALAITGFSPGFAGSAVIDLYAEGALAVHGDPRQTQAGIDSALQMWASYADDTPGAPLSELVWTIGPIHHLVMPVQDQPGLLMLAMIDREFGDLARARWQLAVARNEFA